jgi:type II secretion system protein N
MRLTRQSLIYAGIGLWGLIVMLGVITILFPYQKALRIVAQNVLGSSRMIVALEGSRLGFTKAQASKLLVGHVAVEGKPLFELRDLRIQWYPLSILLGRLSVFGTAVAYDGVVECTIDRIPALANGIPVMRLKFERIKLVKYPEETLPWFKGMSGTMSGWISMEVPLTGAGDQKGSFRIIMTSGEFRELHIKDLQNFVLGYNEITAEGKISGSRITVDEILVKGDGIQLKGSGTIERGVLGQKVNLTFVCENHSGNPLLSTGSIITVTGNQWSPTITISAEPAQHDEKVAALGERTPMYRFTAADLASRHDQTLRRSIVTSRKRFAL